MYLCVVTAVDPKGNWLSDVSQKIIIITIMMGDVDIFHDLIIEIVFLFSCKFILFFDDPPQCM